MIDHHILMRTPQDHQLIIANHSGTPAFHHTPHPYEVRMSHTQALSELLDALPPNWTQEQRDNTLASLGVLQNDIDNAAERAGPDHLDDLDYMYTAELLGWMSYYVVTNRSALTTESIITTPENKLEELLAWYQQTTREEFNKMLRIETTLAKTDPTGTLKYSNGKWMRAQGRMQRHASYLWQVERRLGQR